MKKTVFQNPLGTSSAPSNTASLIVQIIILIAKLILAGYDEQKSFEIASSKFSIPVETVSKIWKKHK